MGAHGQLPVRGDARPGLPLRRGAGPPPALPAGSAPSRSRGSRPSLARDGSRSRPARLRQAHQVGSTVPARPPGPVIEVVATAAPLEHQHGLGHRPALIHLPDHLVRRSPGPRRGTPGRTRASPLISRTGWTVTPSARHRHREPREAPVLGRVPVGAGQAHAVVGVVGTAGPDLRAVETHSSPSRSARVMMPARSEPAPGSEKNCTNSSSPASIWGTCRERNSGEPCRMRVCPTGP